jgi:hypothetical protein
MAIPPRARRAAALQDPLLHLLTCRRAAPCTSGGNGKGVRQSGPALRELSGSLVNCRRFQTASPRGKWQKEPSFYDDPAVATQLEPTANSNSA